MACTFERVRSARRCAGCASASKRARDADPRRTTTTSGARGYICPKGTVLGELHHDPDRLRAPLVRDGDGWREVELGRSASRGRARGCARRARAPRRDAVTAYIGNPTAHNFSLSRYVPAFIAMSGIPQTLLRRHGRSVAEEPRRRAAVRRHVGVPGPGPRSHRLPADARREPARFAGQPARRARHARALRRDPKARRARRASSIPRRTGTRGTRASGCRSTRAPTPHSCSRWRTCSSRRSACACAASSRARTASTELRALVAEFTPEAVASACRDPRRDDPPHRARAVGAAARRGVRPHRHLQPGVRHARVLAGRRAQRAHGQPRPRGRLDVREPGRVVADLAADRPSSRAAVTFGRWKTRVRGAPEVLGQVPVSCLAEEIATPGDGQLKALITIAGNPAISCARRSDRLDDALPQLEFMVSLDNWINETTRHAHVILPGLSQLEQPHYDEMIWTLGDSQRRAIFAAPVRRGPAPRGVGAAAHARGDLQGCEARRREHARARSAVLRGPRRRSHANAELAHPRPQGGRDRRRERRHRPGAHGSTSRFARGHGATHTARIPAASRWPRSRSTRTASIAAR